MYCHRELYCDTKISRELFALCPFCFCRKLDSPDEVVVDLYLLDTCLSGYVDRLTDQYLLYEFSQNRRSKFRQVIILFSNPQELLGIELFSLQRGYFLS